VDGNVRVSSGKRTGIIHVTSLRDQRAGAAEHARQVILWIEALGFDHHLVVADQDITITDADVQFTAFVPDAKGKRQMAADDQGSPKHTVVLPLTVNPEDYGL
jgi:hypothetical protein